MQVRTIINEISQLSIDKKFLVMEETLKSIKLHEENQQMEMAVNELYNDYATNKELTTFTSLDLEDFYETK